MADNDKIRLPEGFIDGLRATQAAVEKSMGVPAFWFARAIETGSQEMLVEPYRNSVWVQGAIKRIAGPVSSVPVEFYPAANEATGFKAKSVKGGTRMRVAGRWSRRSQEDSIEVPQMAAFLRSPMKGLGYSDFCEAVIGWLKLAGEAFIVLDDTTLVPFPEARPVTGSKTVPQVIVARPDRMRHVVDQGELVGWEFIDGQGSKYTLLPEQVIQIKYWNPYDKWRGLGEYEPAQIAAEGDYLAGKFSRNLMANNGDTGPYIIAKNGVPTDPQREQILMDLRAKREAQLRGNFRPIFLTGDITVEDPQVKSVDGNFVTQRLENRHEIFIAFGIPPSLADVKASYSIGSASDFYQLIANTCVPVGDKFCDGLERLAMRLFKLSIEVGLDWEDHPVFQEVRKERLASVDSLWNKGMPMRCVSDYLGLKLPDFEGDDVGYLPISVTPVTEAEATPEPATNPDLAEPEGTDSTPVEEMLQALRAQTGQAGQPCQDRECKAKNQRLWEAHMRRREPVRKMFFNKAGRVINDFRGKTLRKWEQWTAAHKSELSAKSEAQAVVMRSLVDLIFDHQEFGAALRVAITPVHTSALETAGKQLFEEIGRKDDPWTMPPAKALEFTKGRKGALEKVGETVREQLNTVITNGYEQGSTLDEITDALKGRFNDLSRTEARRIALTETTMAFSTARDQAMHDAGIEYKGWLSSHGPHVRLAHAAAEAKYTKNPIPLDEPFEVGGEELMYPGDPAGSPENIINCQCVQTAEEGPGE